MELLLHYLNSSETRVEKIPDGFFKEMVRLCNGDNRLFEFIFDEIEYDKCEGLLRQFSDLNVDLESYNKVIKTAMCRQLSTKLNLGIYCDSKNMPDVSVINNYLQYCNGEVLSTEAFKQLCSGLINFNDSSRLLLDALQNRRLVVNDPSYVAGEDITEEQVLDQYRESVLVNELLKLTNIDIKSSDIIRLLNIKQNFHLAIF